MSEFKPIESQEELDSIVEKHIAREREKYDDLKNRVLELETEKGNLESALADAKKSDDTIADLQQKIAGFESKELRTKIALQNGLPLDLAERLQGDDEDTLKADAERLAGYFKATEPPAPLKDNEPSLVDSKDAAWLDVARSLGNKGE